MTTYPRITPILRQLVLDAPNGLPAKAVAELVRRDYTTLLAEVGERSGHKTGVELLLPIMNVTGSCLPLDVMAEHLGGFFVRMPDVPGGSTAVVTQCMTSVKEFGELMTAVADALKDGSISEEERRDITEKGYHAQTAILALLRLVAEAVGELASLTDCDSYYYGQESRLPTAVAGRNFLRRNARREAASPRGA